MAALAELALVLTPCMTGHRPALVEVGFMGFPSLGVFRASVFANTALWQPLQKEKNHLQRWPNLRTL
jgi:hypothetical protein